VTTASVLKLALGPSGPRPRGLLAFGNPRSVPTLPPLPHAEEEVKALEGLFGADAIVRYGERATRAELLSLLRAPAGSGPAFGFLHLSTHGILDARSPLDSWLALDGANRLVAREIPALDLGGIHTVTLSACETGLGESDPGVDVMGLADVFGLAGVPSVVVSLWQVSDRATRNLMVAFYETLRRQPTLDKASALRAAQVTLAARPETRHPFFWSAFILVGDWR
jgi:CHAT domain-containing protein